MLSSMAMLRVRKAPTEVERDLGDVLPTVDFLARRDPQRALGVAPSTFTSVHGEVARLRISAADEPAQRRNQRFGSCRAIPSPQTGLKSAG
jgi:hypothetical protein